MIIISVVVEPQPFFPEGSPTTIPAEAAGMLGPGADCPAADANNARSFASIPACDPRLSHLGVITAWRLLAQCTVSGVTARGRRHLAWHNLPVGNGWKIKLMVSRDHPGAGVAAGYFSEGGEPKRGKDLPRCCRLSTGGLPRKVFSDPIPSRKAVLNARP